MNVSFALFCDAANLSQEGKLNILGVFDAVQVVAVPTIHPRAHLVVRFKGRRTDVGSHSVVLRWTGPEGKELWSSGGQLDVGTPPAGVTEMDLPLIAAIDLPIESPGTHTMTIALDGSRQADVILQVRSGPPVPTPGGIVS
jgi:hypothetical protein